VSKHIVPVDDSRVEIRTSVYHCFEHGLLTCYYIGYADECGTACRLSDISRDYAEIKLKFKNKDYARRMIVTEYDNGNKVYTAVW